EIHLASLALCFRHRSAGLSPASPILQPLTQFIFLPASRLAEPISETAPFYFLKLNESWKRLPELIHFG
ncbi:MAG: hypothetical protein VX333_02100, partial [SAR324 cluster bacterium]|nr:hypothetical protein [SAR324 cluster bacterium]